MEILGVELLTNDLQGTLAFYKDVMGFELLSQTLSSITFKSGATQLKFKTGNVAEPVYHFAFNIPCNQLDSAYNWIADRIPIMDVTPGHKIADFVNWNARSFYFYDNNGNILELIARFDLENESSAGFCTKSILCISEIGIATEDVKHTSNELIDKNRLPIFAKQPRLENFAALGDHHGLLIISSADRHWYPTEKRAQKIYTALNLKNGEDIIELCFS